MMGQPRGWAWGVAISLALASGTGAVRASAGQPESAPPSSTLAAKAESAPSPAASAPLARMEDEVIRRVNSLRRERNLEPLRPNAVLARMARDYSRLMAESKFFGHTSPDGRGVAERVTAAGLSYRVVAENLFKGSHASDPVKMAVEGWMKSPGHRENILRAGVTETGVGIWKTGNTYHVTQVFIQPR